MSVTAFRGYATAAIAPNSTAYTSGDLIGGKLSLAGLVPCKGGKALISDMTLSDLAKQNAAIDIVFFNSDPTGTTFTNNAVLDIADADLTKVAGFFSITASDYASFSTNSAATVKPAISVETNATSVVYAAAVCRGTPTYASASDLQLKVHTL